MGAGRQAHRRLVARSHLDDDAGRTQAEAAHRDRAAPSSASRRGRPTARRVAFAADRGDGFDIYVAPAAAAAPRCPSRDARRRAVAVVDAGRPPRLRASRRAARGRPRDPACNGICSSSPGRRIGAWQAPLPLTDTTDNETYPRVSPDGRRVAFVSDRDSTTTSMCGRCRCRPRPWPSRCRSARAPVRRAGDPAARAPADTRRAAEGPPARRARHARARRRVVLSWAPDSTRLAFYARARRRRLDLGRARRAAAARGRRARPVAAPRAGRAAAARVASRRRARLVARRPDAAGRGPARPQPVYNGNPLRRRGRGAAALRRRRARSSCGASPRRCRCTTMAGALIDRRCADAGALMPRRSIAPGRRCAISTTRPARRPRRGRRAAREVPAARAARAHAERRSRTSSTRWSPSSRSSSRS